MTDPGAVDESTAPDDESTLGYALVVSRSAVCTRSQPTHDHGRCGTQHSSTTLMTMMLMVLQVMKEGLSWKQG